MNRRLFSIFLCPVAAAVGGGVCALCEVDDRFLQQHADFRGAGNAGDVHEVSLNPDDQLRRDLILVAASVHAPPPRGRVYANCFRVLGHALNAAGLWEPEFTAAFHGDEEDLARFPLVAQWYSTLIDLTRSPESERLLEGGGNLGEPPSGAYFTACWLTPAGKTVAERLLTEHPEWKDRVTARAEGQQP